MRNKLLVLVVGLPLIAVCVPSGRPTEADSPSTTEPSEPSPAELQVDITPVDPAVGALLIEVQSSQPAPQWVQRCVPGGQAIVSVPEIIGGQVEVAASAFAETCPLAEGLQPLSVSEIVALSVEA